MVSNLPTDVNEAQSKVHRLVSFFHLYHRLTRAIGTFSMMMSSMITG